MFPRAFLSWFYFSSAVAVIVNRTIDDTFPDSSGNKIQYFPNEKGRVSWNIGGQCDACTAGALDPTQVFDKTWHDGTYNPDPGSNDFPNVPLNASVTFNGTAIYVFCVLAKTTSGPDGNSDMSFYIDGELSGTFVKKPPNMPGFDYHVPVYVNESLSTGTHEFLLQNGHVNGTKSLVLLDQIIYSFDDGIDPNPGSSSTSSSGSGTSAPDTSSQSPSPDTTDTPNPNSALGSFTVPLLSLVLVSSLLALGT
ncbi:hypothetical protein VKT23_013435 [Stygiomarasmius scandens]|uniref:Uncharacterized protein n=1 Tax=Marasmiellus scandens TaxID=2682957 RepID=A0ABR1J4N5_9AGAR